jgi:hypothetical protein
MKKESCRHCGATDDLVLDECKNGIECRRRETRPNEHGYIKVALVALVVTVIFAAGLGAAGVRPALSQTEDHRITICHDVQGNGNTGNGFDIITVDKDSIVNKDGQIVPNGHGTHEGDAIPAFAAGSSGSHEWGAFGGQNGDIDPSNNCASRTTTTTTTGTTTTTTTQPTTTTTTTTSPPTTTTTTQPPTTTQTTETTTTQPPPPGTTTTTTTAPPPATTETTQTTPTSPTPTQKPPSHKPKPKPSPTPRSHKPPPCPPGGVTTARCGVQGMG